MSETLPVEPARMQIWPMYRAMVGVGLLCGLLIVTVFQLTGPVIARNRIHHSSQYQSRIRLPVTR